MDRNEHRSNILYLLFKVRQSCVKAGLAEQKWTFENWVLTWEDGNLKLSSSDVEATVIGDSVTMTDNVERINQIPIAWLKNIHRDLKKTNESTLKIQSMVV